MKLMKSSNQLTFSMLVSMAIALLAFDGSLLTSGLDVALAAGATSGKASSGKASTGAVPAGKAAAEKAPVKDSPALVAPESEDPFSAESAMPDEPIEDLKRPAGAGDDYPGDDMLFDEQESKSAKLESDSEIPDTSGYDADERRQLAEFKLGPSIALGIPHPLTYGLEILHGNYIGGSFSLGSTRAKVSKVSVGISNWDVRVRWFPWRSSFFAGLAAGQQKASADVDKDNLEGGALGKLDATISLTAKTTYVSPHVGWNSTWDGGFTVSGDLGVQLPVKSKEEFRAKFNGNFSDEQVAQLKATDDYKKLESDAKSLAKRVGNSVLPYVTLVRLGWLF